MSIVPTLPMGEEDRFPAQDAATARFRRNLIVRRQKIFNALKIAHRSYFHAPSAGQRCDGVTDENRRALESLAERVVGLVEPIHDGGVEDAHHHLREKPRILIVPNVATRLAIVNQLDHEHERLPMFIDEALVNWDAARRNRGFQLLRELSQTRQVFVMTCHENWAEELTEAGAHRIDLA